MSGSEDADPTGAASQSAHAKPNLLVRVLCRKILNTQPAKSAEPVDYEEPGDPDRAGVAALLGIATDAVADERDRGRELDSKAASLAGFSGLILSVNGLLVNSVFRHHVGSLGGPLAKWSFIAAIVALLLAVIVAVLGVLMPQGYRGMGREQIRDFTSPSVQAHSELWVQQSMLGALAAILDHDRPVNDCKAHLAKIVARLLAIAFVLVAVEATTIVLQKVNL